VYPEIVVGGEEGVPTVTVRVTPEVVPHDPGFVLRTQYVVFSVGLTLMLTDVCPAMMFEPTVPVPHSYAEPDTCVPPAAVKVTVPTPHIVEVPVIEVGAVDTAVTVTVVLSAEVTVLHGVGSTLRTQYDVVAVGFTVIEAPVAPEIIPEPIVGPVPH
jgi:hypothetical protein